MIADIQSTAEMAKVAEQLKICNHCSIKLAAYRNVSILPEVF